MADETTTTNTNTPATTAAPGAQAQGNPSTAQDAGFERISAGELATLRREAEQARGMRPFYQKASEYGLKSDKELGTWGPAIQAFIQQGRNPQALMQAFSDPGATENGDEPRFDPDEFKRSVLEEARLERFESEHESALKAEMAKMSKDTLASMFGKDAPDWFTELAEQAAYGKYQRMREKSFYPDGHPLSGKRLAPLGDKHGEVETWLKDVHTRFKGQGMVATAQAAGKAGPPSGTPAGNKGGQGTPKQEEENRNGLPSRDKALAALRQIRAKRGDAA